MSLAAVPMKLAEANAFVSEHHRHHKPVVGHKFSIGAIEDRDARRRRYRRQASQSPPR